MFERIGETLGGVIGGKIGATLRRSFGVDREYYTLFHEMLGFTPHNIDLYKLALIHRSASYHIDEEESEAMDGVKSVVINNERLEYLGDAIIEAVTSDYLYIEFPQCDEGFLTKMRSKIVSRASLNEVALSLGLNELIITSKSINCQQSSEQRGGAVSIQKNLMGDAFEALIGAIYLDMGYDFTNRFLINDIFTTYIDMDSLQQVETDFKSRLIEWAQKEHHKIEFVTRCDNHDRSKPPLFLSVVYIGGMEIGHGSGSSKKEAEQSAAFSVAQGNQGLSDDYTDKILNKLDRIESESKSVEPCAEEECATSPINTQTPEIEQDVHID